VDHGTGKIWKVFVALVGVPKQKKTHRGVNDQQQGDQDDGIQHGRQRSQQGGQGTLKSMNVCLEEKTSTGKSGNNSISVHVPVNGTKNIDEKTVNRIKLQDTTP
jgi:hypothetical protein